jgi:hypothetical protein
MKNGECKGCSATVRLSQEEIDEIFGQTTEGKECQTGNPGGV